LEDLTYAEIKNMTSDLPYATNDDLRATEDNIIILPEKWRNVTLGGIELPEMSEERPHRGVIIDIGPGKVSDHLGYRVSISGYEIGQRVLFTKFGGARQQLPGQDELYILKPEHILARIDTPRLPDLEEQEETFQEQLPELVTA
jgi:co-chaperonin GroES (HSP10)